MKKKDLTENLYNNGKVYGGQKIFCSKCKKPSTYTEWLDREGGYLQYEICDNCGVAQKAGRDNKIDTYDSCYYKQKCKCGNKLFVLTQPDHNPEYYTKVGIQCWECEEINWFMLAVN